MSLIGRVGVWLLISRKSAREVAGELESPAAHAVVLFDDFRANFEQRARRRSRFMGGDLSLANHVQNEAEEPGEPHAREVAEELESPAAVVLVDDFQDIL